MYKVYSNIFDDNYYVTATNFIDEKYGRLEIVFFNCSDEIYEKLVSIEDITLNDFYCNLDDFEVLTEDEVYSFAEIEGFCKKYKYLYDFEDSVFTENLLEHMNLYDTYSVLDTFYQNNKDINDKYLYLRYENSLKKLNIKTNKYKSSGDIIEVDFGHYELFLNEDNGTYTVIFCEKDIDLYVLDPDIRPENRKFSDYYLVDVTIEEVLKKFDFDINEIKALIQNK